MAKDLSIWTIGHSILSIEDFIARLTSLEIALLADVRSFPGSRRYPHFNKENLSAALSDAGIRYEHFRELGGRRRPRPDSLNMTWRNESFRGYADYMKTLEFQQAIDRLKEAAATQTCAILCAEAVWWRCHRSLIADYLKVSGMTVVHILGLHKNEEHPYTSPARSVDGHLTYHEVE